MALVDAVLNREQREEVRRLKPAAERGDASAQYELGDVYLCSHPPTLKGLAFKEAAKWYLRASRQGHVEATQRVIEGSIAGILGFEMNIKLGITLLKEIAEKGDRAAQYELANWYMTPGRDSEEGLRWLHRAAEEIAEKGDGAAQYELANWYMTPGWDWEEGLRWLHRAAEESNDKNAQYDLGMLYYDGRYVQQNYAKAFNLILHSATQGQSYARRQLYELYFEGVGTPKDLVKGYAWYHVEFPREDNNFSHGITICYDKMKSVYITVEQQKKALEMATILKKQQRIVAS